MKRKNKLKFGDRFKYKIDNVTRVSGLRLKKRLITQSLWRWRKLANQKMLIDCVFLVSVLLGNLVLVAKAWVDYLLLPARRPEQAALRARISLFLEGCLSLLRRIRTSEMCRYLRCIS